MSTPRVFVHVGLPKTGTSYLQTILWSNRPALRGAGLLVPGRERRDHLWASLAVRDDPSLRRRGPRAPRAWEVLREEIADWDGDALVSHEFLSSASAEQAKRMVDELGALGGGREVHLVATAREPLSLFTSSWQEHLKNKGRRRIGRYAETVSEDPTVVWNWRALDLRLVLERWGAAVPAERVHVVTAPDLWERFCTVLGLDPAVAEPAGFANSSMGVVEAETLRRLNPRLSGFKRAFDRGVWIRSYLADGRLVPRGGEPFWPGPDQVAACRRRGEDAVRFVRESGFDVVGDLDALRVPEEIPPRRHPDSVTDAEVAAVALDLVVDLLEDVRRLTRDLDELRRQAPG